MAVPGWLGWQGWGGRAAGARRGRRRRRVGQGPRSRRVSLIERLEQRTLLTSSIPLAPPLVPAEAGSTAAALSLAALAQDLPVNRFPAGNQDSPAVAMDAAGNYVVVWAAYNSAGQSDIWAKRFDRLGAALGTEFVVNTHFAGSQLQPAVAMGLSGDFVVVWSGQGRDGVNGPIDTRGVFFRRFAFDGTAIDASERAVATYARGTQDRPAVAVDPAGNFVVTWSGEGRSGPSPGTGVFDSRGVWARRFDSLAQPLDRYQVLVNSAARRWTTQEASDVAMDGSGNYFIVWRSALQDGGAWGVYGQRFYADGSRSSGEIHLNARRYGAAIAPRVAMAPDGDAVVVWSGIRRSGYSTHVYARRFNDSGAAVDGGREFIVDSDPNPKAPFLKQQAQVAVSGRGDVVVTWSSYGQDRLGDPAPRDDGVYARLYYADGSDYVDPATGLPLGVFRVNATTLGNQNAPDVAMDYRGNMALVWVGPDGDKNGIWSRLARWTARSTSVLAATANDLGVGAGPVAGLSDALLDQLARARRKTPRPCATDASLASWAAVIASANANAPGKTLADPGGAH